MKKKSKLEIQKVINRLKVIEESSKLPPKEINLSLREFQAALEISKAFAFKLIVKKRITYTKVGGKLYFKLSDIYEMLNKSLQKKSN